MHAAVVTSFDAPPEYAAFEDPVAPVFIDGKLDRTLRGEGLVKEFIDILEDYVDRRYPGPTPGATEVDPARPTATTA